MPELPTSLEQAAKLVEDFGVGPALGMRIASLEAAGQGCGLPEVKQLLAQDDLGEEIVAAARIIKALAGQVNVILHAAGIMVSLPWILEPGEIVESLSLGAGNTGRDHDLQTNRRIAEFKFIDWRGGAEAVRQNNLFADVFSVASARTTKRRVVYVLDTEHPMKFLRGGRAMRSVLSRSPKVRRLFYEAYGSETFATVRDYWATVSDNVEIVDLRKLVPYFKTN